MAPFRTKPARSSHAVRAPRGTTFSCKDWPQEGALRLLVNSLDPEVAEQPENLKPCGTIGKLARDRKALQAMLDCLQKLKNNETLMIENGATQGVREMPEDAPRVIALASDDSTAERYAMDWMFTGPASALPETFEVFRSAAQKHFGGTLAGRLVVSAGMGGTGGAQALAATLNGGAFLGIDVDAAPVKRRLKAGFCEVMVNNLGEALRILKNAVRKREPASVGLVGNAAAILPELAERGVLPDLLTDQTPADDFAGAYIPAGLTPAQAAEFQQNDSEAFRKMMLDSIAAQVRAMLKLKDMGATVIEFGNGIFGAAAKAGVAQARELPNFVLEYLAQEVMAGRGLLNVIPLSGDPADVAKVDEASESLVSNSDLRKWIVIGRRHPPGGLPARSLWADASEAANLGSAINSLVATGTIKAPVALGRSLHRVQAHPTDRTKQREHPAAAGTLVRADEIDALQRAASGASWIGLRKCAAPNVTRQISVAIVADGSATATERIRRAFSSDFGAALFAF